MEILLYYLIEKNNLIQAMDSRIPSNSLRKDSLEYEVGTSLVTVVKIKCYL